jgi:hypothetical protein
MFPVLSATPLETMAADTSAVDMMLPATSARMVIILFEVFMFFHLELELPVNGSQREGVGGEIVFTRFFFMI